MIYDEMNSVIYIKEMPEYDIVYERWIGNYSEMKTMLVAGIAVVIMLIMIFATVPYCKMFLSDTRIVTIASRGIRINMTSFLFAGINCIASMYFTAIGRAKESAVISSARGLVILLIAIFVLPAVWGITGLWLISLVTETITIFLTLHYLKKDRKAIE